MVTSPSTKRRPTSASQFVTLLRFKELPLRRNRPVLSLVELLLPAALCALLVVGAEELILRTTFAADAFPGESLHCAIMAALVALKEVWPLALGGRLEFLPLMLTSVYGAVAVVALTAYSSRRLLAAARRRNAGDWEASVVAPSPRQVKPARRRSLLKTICSLLGSRDED